MWAALSGNAKRRSSFRTRAVLGRLCLICGSSNETKSRFSISQRRSTPASLLRRRHITLSGCLRNRASFFGQLRRLHRRSRLRHRGSSVKPGCFLIAECRPRRRLCRNYTQNIDTLEQVAGIKNVIQCHGSFNTASCMICKYQVPGSEIEVRAGAGS